MQRIDFKAKSAVIGQMRHDLFEKCLTKEDFSREFVNCQAPKIVRDHTEQLIGCGIYSEHESVKDVLKIQPQLQRFAHAYTAFEVGQESCSDSNAGSQLDGHGISPTVKFVAKNIQDTEEGTVSVELGLKGFVDATVKATVKGCAVQRTIHGNERPSPPQTALMGIELKTGHRQTPFMNHVAQLSLYTLTLRSRYGTVNGTDQSSPGLKGALNGGMLLYLNHESINAVHVSPEINEIKSLLSQRNTVASEFKRTVKPRGITIRYEKDKDDEKGKDSEHSERYVSSRKLSCYFNNCRLNSTFHEWFSIIVHPPTPIDLPPLLSLSHSCERCYVNRECMLFAAVSNDSSSQKQHQPLLQHFTGHLDQVELEYFRQWDRLIDLESIVSNHGITKAWLINSLERERSTGKTISSLVLSDCGDSRNPLLGYDKGEDDVFIVKLERSVDSELTTPLNTLKFEIGSRVVLSSDGTSLFQLGQKHNFGIMRGSVKEIENNALYIRVGEADAKRVSRLKLAAPIRATFRLDKDEFTTGTGILRQNLISLFTSDIPPFVGKQGLTEELLVSIHDRTKSRFPWLRRSIIHLDLPKFDPIGPEKFIFSPAVKADIQGCCLESLSNEFHELNSDQKAAVQKVSQSFLNSIYLLSFSLFLYFR